MGKSISRDLRLRLVRGVAAGKSRRAVAIRFEVAPSTAVRVQSRFVTTGSVDPAKQGRPVPGKGPIPLDQQLCFLLYGANIAISRAYKSALDDVGITLPQYLVLSAVSEKDGQTIGAIAERLALEPSTITPLVKRLEASSFLSRRRNPEDERQVTVHLTQAGSDRCVNAYDQIEAVHQGVRLSEVELSSLNRQLQILRGKPTG